MNCFLTIFALGVIGLVQSIPPDFDYDFSGFKQLTQLMPTTCNDIEGQVCAYHNCLIAFPFLDCV
jgi:hypothetical protein